MYEIRGIRFSFNTTKVVYVAEELGVEYDYREIDLSKGENKSEDHLARHPLGKLPTLTFDGKHLFESGAICRYLASTAKSDLYPSDAFARAQVDQWMDFFTAHLGRWLATLLFERVFRAKFGLGEINKDAEKEALGFTEQQLAALDKSLAQTGYLVGSSLTIADLFGYAYVETAAMSQVSLDATLNVKKWAEKIAGRDAIKRGGSKLQAAA